MRTSFLLFTAGLPALLLCCSALTPFQEQRNATLNKMNTAADMAVRGHYADALAGYEDACRSFLLLDDPENEIVCLTSQAMLLIKAGKTARARRDLERALALCTAPYKKLRGRSLVALVLLHVRDGRLETAARLAEEAAKENLKAEDWKRLQAYQGYLAFARDKDEEAQDFFKQARGSGDDELESYVLIHQARLFLRAEKVAQAEKAARRALDLDRKQNRPEFLAYDYEILARIALVRGNSLEAIAYHKRAYDLYSALGDQRRAARNWQTLQRIKRSKAN